jgi:hypothetical protein
MDLAALPCRRTLWRGGHLKRPRVFEALECNSPPVFRGRSHRYPIPARQNALEPLPLSRAPVFHRLTGALALRCP